MATSSGEDLATNFSKRKETSLTPTDAVDAKSDHKTPPQPKFENRKYIPMVNCFQLELFHGEIVVESPHHYDDPSTFQVLRKCYWRSLGRLGRWRNYLSFRRLESINRVNVRVRYFSYIYVC